ncbi:S1 RNA-binding domain-containing protein [uncultured Streptomyces sp.]|uniref:S1 RNA-binding domain-containing protein n=1 Tax=uncultured Streptomyces sp. TaxID=174707 RepID=UPI002634923F|nr:S1 RNA-binding domain-containing protein [uncultured Streptomyces sp.]
MLPHVYRITKYDPRDRGDRGRFRGTEEAVGDHGPVEAACLDAVAAFAEARGIGRLTIREPEAGTGIRFGAGHPVPGHGLAGLFPPDLAGYHDGAVVSLSVALELVRAMLRESGAWCRLEAEGEFAVHVGWDRCLYVGSNTVCEEAVARTRGLGLFAERVEGSPYDFEDDPDLVRRPADDDFWGLVRRSLGTLLLEETHAHNASRWHRLTPGNLESVRARLAPRAMLAVWPDLFTDVPTALRSLPDEGLAEILREDADGRMCGTVVDMGVSEAVAASVAGARAAAVVSLSTDERHPLHTAVMPDQDGVLRARWQTDPTPGDREWAFMSVLRPGQLVTGTVTAVADFGVTFVDLGGCTALINLPELSHEPVGSPADAVRVGETVTAEVVEVDLGRLRVSLSLKRVRTPD